MSSAGDDRTGAAGSRRALLAEIRTRLAAAGVPTPHDDALRLLSAVPWSDAVVGVDGGADAGGSHLAANSDLARLVERREAREPLEYLTGVARFRQLELAVGPGVFLPRRESEVAVELALEELRALPGEPIVVDLGTGSGAIALAVATEAPGTRVVGVEVSPAAYAFTEQNFRRFAPGNGRPVLADLRDALPELDGTVDLVVANPPYIPSEGIPRDPEVRLHSPAVALFGGSDGLDLVRGVCATARRLLRSGGRLLVEHGEVQAASVSMLLPADHWSEISVHRDHLGRDRVTAARLRQDVG